MPDFNPDVSRTSLKESEAIGDLRVSEEAKKILSKSDNEFWKN